MRREDSLTQHMDWYLFGVIMLMLFMGIANVYSAAFDPDHPNLFDFSQKYGKQIMWIAISLFLGLLVFLIDSDIYRKFAIPIYIFCFVLLIIVLFMPAVHGAHAWLGIGSMGIQPAEFMKIGAALLLSKYMGTVNVKQQNIQSVIVALGIIIIPMVMILLQPDAGTFVVFTSFFFVMYREGITFDPLVLKLVNLYPGFRFKETWVGSHFIPILFYIIFLSVITLLMSKNEYEFFFLPGIRVNGLVGVIIVITLMGIIGYLFLRYISSKRDQNRVLLIIIIAWVFSSLLSTGVFYSFSSLKPHQKDRIELVLGLRKDDDGDDYNRNRAMAAVGSGGLFGKGYKNASVASVRSNHVPESETDFIFCPLAEEWGFMGSLAVVGVFMFLLFRVISIAERQRSTFNRVYAYCVAMILFYHFAVNIGMNIGFVPVIGIPLPLFSCGGSSMMSFTMMLFILLKLDSQRRDALF